MDSFLFDPLCLTRLNKAIRFSDTQGRKQLISGHPQASHLPTYQHAMGIVAGHNQQPIAIIHLYRHKTAPDFSMMDLTLLSRLALHTANAIYLQDTSITLEPLRETGLLVFDADLQLIYKNESVNVMLEGIPLETAIQMVNEDKMWLRNGSELYRVERVPQTPNSLLRFLTPNLDSTKKSEEGISATLTVISVEPFRRRQAIANRLKHIGLSQREIEVSIGIMRGLSNSNIAKQLFIDEKTVKDHLQRIFAKVHIKSRTELISKLLGLNIELAHHEPTQLTEAVKLDN